MNRSPDFASGALAGRYTIDRVIGRGATSIVYLAHENGSERGVALKVLREELISEINTWRFLREIRITTQLEHPNIVPVLDSGELDGRPYFVLPHMSGGTLRSRLQAEKQLPILDVIAIGSTVARALHFAHGRHLLHRDVKPENILFAEDGRACLADFGIARALMESSSGESTTSTGVVRGTPAYMSPEQAAGDRDIDARSDTYSLACVLYEALAGVPAFVGPTPQSIVAQRISHVPRGVGMYRPTVPRGLEQVLNRALATTPADRYQTAAEFADALAAVPLPATDDGEPSLQRIAQARSTRRILVIALTTLGVVTLGVAVTKPLGNVRSLWSSDPALDTARVAVLPFEAEDTSRHALATGDLVYEGIRRWKGLGLVESFQVSDAIRRHGSPRSAAQAQVIARELGAGQFIRGRVTRAAGSSRVYAALFDTRSNRVLYETSTLVADDTALAVSSLYRLADSLALRGERVDVPAGLADAAGNFPATRAMILARAALGEWDLPAAESLYSRALSHDPASARAALWTAQIHAWRGLPRETYMELARYAARNQAGLTAGEKRLAVALAAMSEADFPRACQLYLAITTTSPRDFAGWYGLGQCHDLDHVVVPDPQSPTKWRFRASYQRAIDAYLKAFELLPSVYRGYQGSAFATLGRLLYTSSRFRRRGETIGPNPKSFYAVPILDADTLAFVPIPFGEMATGSAQVNRDLAARAFERTRSLFHRITSGWAIAFPNNPGPKEGLGLSLEILGDPAAIDTIRSALRLATDPAQRLRLAGTLAWLQVKFGAPDRLDLLVAARRTADSVLGGVREARPSDADVLGRFAALTGHCRDAAVFVRRGAPPITGPGFTLPPALVADAHARLAFVALGCRVPDSLPSLDQLSARANLGAAPPAAQLSANQMLLAQIVRSSDVFDPHWVPVLAQTGDFLITARDQIERGKVDSARNRMLRIEEIRRTGVRGDVTPDAVLAESRVWLSLGDTAATIRWLDRSLADTRFYPPMVATESSDNLVVTASLVRAMALRAELAPPGIDRRRWARAVFALWGGADDELRPFVQRMRQLAQ